MCDFSFFRTFYVSAENLIVQCGLEVYNILFTIEGVQGKELSRRMTERAVDGLLQQLAMQLPRGSALTRCADNQLLAMMGADGYEAACLCCERNVNRFYQNNPAISVKLRYGVWRVGENRME